MKEISETEKEKLIQALNNIKIEYCFNDNPLYHNVLSLYEVIKMAQQAAKKQHEAYRQAYYHRFDGIDDDDAMAMGLNSDDFH